MSRKRDGRADVATTDNGDAIYVPDSGTGTATEAKPAKPPRDKRGSFVRLTVRRVNRAIKDIRSLVPLANKSAYSYDEADANMILSALRDAIEDVTRAFSGQIQARPTFTLH